MKKEDRIEYKVQLIKRVNGKIKSNVAMDVDEFANLTFMGMEGFSFEASIFDYIFRKKKTFIAMSKKLMSKLQTSIIYTCRELIDNDKVNTTKKKK